MNLKSNMIKLPTDSTGSGLMIHGFLAQRNISKKNITYLKRQCKFPDEEVQRYANLVLEIARVTPQKRNRIKFLAKHHPALLAELEESSLLLY